MAQTDWTRRAKQSTASTQPSAQAQLAENAPELAAIFGDPAIVERIHRQSQSDSSSPDQVQAVTVPAGCAQHVTDCLLQPQSDLVFSQAVLPPLDQALPNDALSTDMPQLPEVAPLLAASADPQPVVDYPQPLAPQAFIDTLHRDIDNPPIVPPCDTSSTHTYSPCDPVTSSCGQADYMSSLADQNQQSYQQQYAAAAQTWTTQQITASPVYRTIQHKPS